MNKYIKLKKNCFYFLCLFLIFSGCKVAFVPNYDPSIEQQIVSTAKANDKLYLQLLATPINKRDYPNFAQAYIDIESEINSIQLKEKARKKNGDMVKIVDILIKHFDEFKDEHKNATTPLNDAKIKIYEHDIQAIWEPLLKAEKGLPHEVPGK